ncbi:MAG TPA: TonB-dependent receptor [Saprospiraceae bacterium]|nr:TonB-dependent receptor [Saprospiraceae bacterium]HPI07390.1 TonB-dependent receptor [Saprospiraceae bacterium]
MKHLLHSFLTICIMLLISSFASAQGRLVTGTVLDKVDNSPLPGVSIRIKGITGGAMTDIDGRFSVNVPLEYKVLVFTSTGHDTQELEIPESNVMTVTMEINSNLLGEVVISTGSRSSQRTITDSPLPIDVLSAKDLQSTGQTSFDKALQYRVPSFNTVNTPVNDATTLLDPYEIRNMGPSRTLVLVNGKRKNLSSLLYVQFSPGRGETGVDLSAIPTDAIKRVEILRDGASAQYGSDAIAGVMNVILKDRYEYSTLNINAGITGEGDGENYGVSLNSGSNFGDRGYVNYTLNFSQQENAVRSGKVDLATEIATFGGNAEQNALIERYLSDYPTAGNINGTGEVSAARFLVNGGLPVGDHALIYANAAYVTKKVISNANFRAPYWRQDRGLLHSITDNGGKNYINAATVAFPEDDPAIYRGYIGYGPTFEGDLTDYNFTVGAKNDNNGWNSDLSFTLGGNKQLYTVDNTVNRTLGTASPTRFKPGGYGFNHAVGNLDVSKAINDDFTLALGAEARSESYSIFAGDTASYSGEGANSFPGINGINNGVNTRFNLGGYVDLTYDITEDFLINGAFRTENYSDFGNANVYKLSSRYKLANDKVVLRGSYSTGFRAPTLHQIYAQSTQASFVGGTIQLSGLFNNRSAQARALGIPNLRPEESTNLALGIGLNPTNNLSISLDYFTINVKDRIVYSSSISSSDPNSTLGMILSKAGVANIQFFINGIETNTSGLDYVASYRNIGLGNGKLNVNLAGNFILNNEIVGTPTEPQAIKDAGSSILSTQIKSLLTESRPEYKSILGLDYAIGKLYVGLNNTLFGPTRFQDLDNGGAIMNHIKAEFDPAVVTDLSLGYNFTNKFSVTFNCNNLLDVLPKWDLVALDAEGAAAISDPAAKSLLRGFLGFSGRYDILGYNGSQFSQLGRMFNLQLSFKF